MARIVVGCAAAIVLATPVAAEVDGMGGRMGLVEDAHAGAAVSNLAAVQTLALAAQPEFTRTALSSGAAARAGAAADEPRPQGLALALGGLALIAFIAHRRFTR